MSCHHAVLGSDLLDTRTGTTRFSALEKVVFINLFWVIAARRYAIQLQSEEEAARNATNRRRVCRFPEETRRDARTSGPHDHEGGRHSALVGLRVSSGQQHPGHIAGQMISDGERHPDEQDVSSALDPLDERNSCCHRNGTKDQVRSVERTDQRLAEQW